MDLRGLARAVYAHRAADVAGLQCPEVFLIAHRHELAVLRLGMIETDGVAGLVAHGVAQIVNGEIAVEADLPPLDRIETDERALDRTQAAGALLSVLYIGPGVADGIGLRADEDVRLCSFRGGREMNAGHLFPH